MLRITVGDMNENLRLTCTCSISKTVVLLSMSNLPATSENVSKLGILVSFKNPLRQVAAVKAYLLDNKVAGQICISLRLREAMNL